VFSRPAPDQLLVIMTDSTSRPPRVGRYDIAEITGAGSVALPSLAAMSRLDVEDALVAIRPPKVIAPLGRRWPTLLDPDGQPRSRFP
jgi:hypothetical protein